MKKVVAFLEKYAEWLALSVACVFFLYMVYSYVISRDQLVVKVGNDTMSPGDVDPHVGETVNRLQQAIDSPATSDIVDQLKVKDSSAEFLALMGDKRPRADEQVTGFIVRPNPGEDITPSPPGFEKIPIVPPAGPNPTITASATGNSLPVPPPPPPPPGEEGEAAPPPP